MIDRDAERILSELADELHELSKRQPSAVATPYFPLPPDAVEITYPTRSDEHFLGRQTELTELDDAWNPDERIAVIEVVAPGGVGKTALVDEWLARLSAKGWHGARRVYGWSFYSQGTKDDRQATEEHFLDEAVKWFGVEVAENADPWTKGQRLAEAVAAERTLLILDGVEPLQYPPGPLAGELRTPGLKTFLEHLTRAGQPGLCVVTSRERLRDLGPNVRTAEHPHRTVARLDLGELSETDGARLLHALGANWAGAAAIEPDDEELRAAAGAVRGHALTLSLLGRYLALAFNGDIRRRDQVDFQEADAETTDGHAFRMVAAYENWFIREGKGRERELAALRLLGFFDRPAHPEGLAALRAEPAIEGLTEPLVGLSPTLWNITLNRLRDCGLIYMEMGSGQTSGTLDAHPLVREFMSRQLAETRPEVWREGHRRIYEQIKNCVPHHPEGLATLQPLYQAVAHGCLAGRQATQQDWKQAAICYHNLSELQQLLGQSKKALDAAQQAVEHTDRSSDFRQRMISRSTLADAHHQHGDPDVAIEYFRKAEAIQTKHQPHMPFLHSLSGYRYCDLLLARAERAIWNDSDKMTGIQSCTMVTKRAKQMLTWAEENKNLNLLLVALNHLTLARCNLYISRLQCLSSDTAAEAAEHSVAGLRAAGQHHLLPLGLLTRAHLRHALGDLGGAEEAIIVGDHGSVTFPGNAFRSASPVETFRAVPPFASPRHRRPTGPGVYQIIPN